MTKEEIGNILKQLRLNANMTQKQVATAIGRTQQIVGHWETGYSQPDADTLFSLCDLYGASVDKAFGFKSKKSSASVETETEDKTLEQLIKNYKSLNIQGQMKLLENSDDLICSGKYTKNNPAQIRDNA